MSSATEKILQQQAKLKTRLQVIKARERVKEKKIEDRKKFLLGGLILERMKSGLMVEADVLAMLDGYLTSDRDRALFGLSLNNPEKPVSKSKSKKSNSQEPTDDEAF